MADREDTVNSEQADSENRGEMAQGTQLATFQLADSLWGIDSARIMEIIRVPDITEIQRVSDSILGVINLRGKIVTVFDLGLRLGLRPSRRDDQSRIIIVQWRDEHVGLLVDRVLDVLYLEEEEAVEQAGDQSQRAGSRFIEGIYQGQEDLVAILKVDEVLSLEEAEE